CTARTVTTLDLKGKTYHVSSLDQPSSDGSGSDSSDTGAGAKDDGSKVSVVITNESLGKKDISGSSTDGYSSNVKMTSTKPSGESNTSEMSLRGYYSGTTYPYVHCQGSAMAAASAMRGGGTPMAGIGNIANLMTTLRDAQGNPRF